MSSSSRTKSNEFLKIENIIANLSNLLDRLSQVKQSIPQCSSSNDSTGNDISKVVAEAPNDDDMRDQFDKLQGDDLNQVEEALQKLQKFEDGAGGVIKNLERSLDEISKVVAKAANDDGISKLVAKAPNRLSIKDKVSALQKDAKKLKMKFPLWPHKMSSTSLHQYSKNGSESDSEVDELPGLHVSHKFLSCSVSTVLQEDFKDLHIRLKLCLLSFAVLPANAVIKRRLLINWWVGECLVDPPGAEESADEILKELVSKGFIEAVNERYKQVPDRFKMQPPVHRVVIMIAQDQLLDYDSKGNPTIRSSQCNRACLVKAKDGTSEQELAPNLYLEKLQTIFNVNEPFPDLRFEWSAKMKKVNIVEWFSKMKNLNVLYLGRWQSSDQNNKEEQISDRHNKGVQSSDQSDNVWPGSLKNHIEVESTEFLKVLKNMKFLRLLSLQGISRINELPNSIGKLTNLRILDLKACHNLEALPDGIASLKNLSRLDISGCYLLDDMPKGLASLSELQVLKGFVIGNSESGRDSCSLENLKGLKKLSKLSINTRSAAFPKEEELEALRKLKALRKLAIKWGVNSGAAQPKRAVSRLNTQQPHPETQELPNTQQPHPETQELPNTQQPHPETQELPEDVEKLELQSFPHSVTPNWLIAGKKLKRLKKLYIRGGNLKNLGQMQEGTDKWTVERLGLKYLEEFNMDREELRKSFPHLKFLENVKCPKLVSLSEIDNIKILYVSG